MTTKIEFTMHNAAFDDEPNIEAARILRDIASKISRETANQGGSIMDINGNKIGYWEFTKEAGERKSRRRVAP